MGTKQNRIQNYNTCKCYIIMILCYLLVCSNYLVKVKVHFKLVTCIMS